jgi:hypothetical protein
LKFNVASDAPVALSNFRQHFFSSSHLKAEEGGKDGEREDEKRDGTVKNPSEAFNLLLQQNFIPGSETLIFSGDAREERGERRNMRESLLYNRNKYFMFLLSFSSPEKHFFLATMERRRQKHRKSSRTEVQQLHKHIHAPDSDRNMCNSSFAFIKFY